MKRRARRNHSPAFKAKVAFAALIGDKTLAQIAEELTSTQIKLLAGVYGFPYKSAAEMST